MVLVTPYVVRAVAQKDLSRPDDGFADPSDPAQVSAIRSRYSDGHEALVPKNKRKRRGFFA